jgi:hypothetical protein
VNRDVQRVRELLGPYDPASRLAEAEIQPGKERTLDRLATTPATTDARPVRRRALLTATVATVLAVAGTAVATGMVGLPGSAGSRSYAATPQALELNPMPGSSTLSTTLNGIAEHAEGGNDPYGAAKYQYVKTCSWNLLTAVRGNASTSAIVPQMREIWRAADGSGRIVTANITTDITADGAASSVGPELSDPASDHTFGPGELSGGDQQWSMTPAALAEQLDEGHPAVVGPSERLVAVADVYREQYVPPALRGALLRVLATSPGVRLDGSTVDRAGRSGIAVSAMNARGLPKRYTLVFDPATGSLLDAEETLTTDPGKLEVKVPAVVSYQLFLSAGTVPRIQTRP